LTFLLTVLLSAALLAGAKETTTLRVLVQNEEGSPVARASLIVKTLKGKKLDKVDETFQLRTSQQGSVPLPPLKQGFALIQVIAEGYQTYGERIELSQPEQTVVVILKPPQDQFSVHKK
jgi:hypothetical protein